MEAVYCWEGERYKDIISKSPWWISQLKLGKYQNNVTGLSRHRCLSPLLIILPFVCLQRPRQPACVWWPGHLSVGCLFALLSPGPRPGSKCGSAVAASRHMSDCLHIYTVWIWSLQIKLVAKQHGIQMFYLVALQRTSFVLGQWNKSGTKINKRQKDSAKKETKDNIVED